MDDLISRHALCEYAQNQKDKSVTPNDIMRFPSAQPETHDKRTETHACDSISRQAAMEEISKQQTYKMFEGEGTLYLDANDVGSVFASLPSAQPDMSGYSDKLWKAAYERGKTKAQAEIVRCKECKYWMPHSQLGFDEDNGTYHDYCAKLVPEDEYYAFYRNADDYCSRAERKTDEQDSE